MAPFALSSKGTKQDRSKGGGEGGPMDSDDDEEGGEGVVNPADLTDDERLERQWCKQKKDEARRTITRFRLKLGGGSGAGGN